MKSIFILFILLQGLIFGQEKSFRFELFRVDITDSGFIVLTENDSIIFQQSFKSFSWLAKDLDLDLNDEFIIIENDSLTHSGHIIYLYNTLDDFFLVDSIVAGKTEPTIIDSDEIQYPVLVSGNPDFDIFFSDLYDNYEPINIWKYEQGELFLANEEIYDLFISENENLTDLLTTELSPSMINCSSVKPFLSVIASLYANYLNAGENSVAVQTLKKYYPCDDYENFKQTLDELLFIKE
ncbi:MAG: hypothetical protein IPM56_06315 [Ignavibacteriales bacterium]|nr:MAG: hypothetical protein IPM56_06315 [Ignavibacteriales bacterium]